MIFTAENILLIGSILLFISIIVGKTGYRFGVPALLLFLVVGMIFGSDGFGLQFHNAKEAQFILALFCFPAVWILNSAKLNRFLFRALSSPHSAYCLPPSLQDSSSGGSPA